MKPPKLLSGRKPANSERQRRRPGSAYIAAMPGWKSDIGQQLDRLIVHTVPDVTKAVKWNSPFYGIQGRDGSSILAVLTKIIQGRILQWHIIETDPPESSEN